MRAPELLQEGVEAGPAEVGGGLQPREQTTPTDLLEVALAHVLETQ